MSKVHIITLGARTCSQKPMVMSWEAYMAFAKKTPGEGDTWKAVLV